MSEFSESYHLESNDQQEGVRLLERAELDGFVFLPGNGWVTMVVESEFGETPAPLIAANDGRLLHYLLDEEAGWMFDIYSGVHSASSYQCRWLDWSDHENRIKIKDSLLDLDLVQSIAEFHAGDGQLVGHLEDVLEFVGSRPRIVTRSSMSSSTGRLMMSMTTLPMLSSDCSACLTTNG
jgi:hypothetical protein